MSSASLSQQIAEKFGDTVASNEKLLAECINMCQIFNLPAEDLFYKWEALNFNTTAIRSEVSGFNMDSCFALKAQLQREVAADNAKKQKQQVKVSNLGGIAVRGSGAAVWRGQGKAAATGVHVKLEPRMNGSRNMDGPSKVVFKGPKTDMASRRKRAYRYMHEKVSERSEVLDDRIDEFGELIREHYQISELGDPSSSTDDEITIVGRITHDIDSSFSPARLTEATLTFESSRMMGSGARIPLRFEPHLKIRGGAQGSGGIGLFPGAIVALKGKNGGGGRFSVSEILVMPPLKPPPSLGVAAKPEQGDGSFSMFIASGPYTPDADLSYTPWHTLLQTINSTKPTVVLLVGPFLDTSHPRFKSGDIDSSPSHFFNTQFITPLSNFLDSSPGSIALILPSVRDLISDHAVFPQCELVDDLIEDNRIHLLPNPSRFSLNNVTFAASSVDVLFHLRKEEYLKRGEELDSISPSADDPGTDSMANLCRHLLQQRSFYPIFPAPLDVSHEVNLDITHAEGLRMDSDDVHAPDVLILPSRLKHFSKVVHDTIALNPSFLTKGTYATINITHGVGSSRERMSVEVSKLEGS